MNRTTALFALALALSLGLNALQWLTAPSSAAIEAGARQSPRGTEEGAAAGAPPAAEDPAETGCWVELAECRADDLDASREYARAFTHHDPLGDEEDGHVGAARLPRPGSEEVDSEYQEDVLETVALGQLRDAWAERKDETIANLVHTVTDDVERGAARDRDLARAYTLLDVPEADRAAFETGYGEIWVAHVEELRDALTATPADTGAALAAVKTLFGDQDAYVAEHLGDEARRRLRIAQAEHRTTVLALLATFADVPWDARITW